MERKKISLEQKSPLQDVRFVGIPGIFIRHYFSEIDHWISNLQKEGPRKKIWLKRDPTEISTLIGDGSDVLPMVPIIGAIVELRAFPFRAFHREVLLVIPVDGRTATIISKHSDSLQAMYDVGEPGKWEIPL